MSLWACRPSSTQEQLERRPKWPSQNVQVMAAGREMKCLTKPRIKKVQVKSSHLSAGARTDFNSVGHLRHTSERQEFTSPAVSSTIRYRALCTSCPPSPLLALNYFRSYFPFFPALAPTGLNLLGNLSARRVSRITLFLQRITTSLPQDAADARHGTQFTRVQWNQGRVPCTPRRVIPMSPDASQTWNAI
ncbi:hypothetical protein NDU88_006938 [Pleurodeles waltl]|uniref:Uncharacterized protein n=1 Tax=Pleurodeles waltl TaxID=8319 RepID=A0AAV7WC09_PLEWA|nr:hypothetical protein NDU88_006938 [Pleurodeles waltl]